MPAAGAPRTWTTDRAACARVQTGQLYTVHADNPAHLPSFELLEMQWNLMRVGVMCGAADVDENDGRSESDDDVLDSGEYVDWDSDGSIPS